MRMRWFVLACVMALGGGANGQEVAPTPAVTPAGAHFQLETVAPGAPPLRRRFSAPQRALLEKLNRRDTEHLARLTTYIVPDVWDLDELAYSPLPADYPAAVDYPKFLV